MANTSGTDLTDVSITSGPSSFTSRTTMSVADVTSTDLPVTTTEVLSDGGTAHLTIPARSVVVLAG